MKEIETDPGGRGLRVGIVLSRFNRAIGEGMLGACVAALKEAGVADEEITLVTVPGALEAPLALQKMAGSGKFDALIALGAVVRGETYHFEIVANQSASGLMAVQLDSGVPIANGILTTDSDDQATSRAREKGSAVAMVAIEMANLLKRLDER